MARPKQTSLKSEREKKKRLKQKDKEEKREQRKANSNKGKGFDNMIAYVDHNGQLSNSPPDPKLKVEVKLEDISLGSRNVIREGESSMKSGRIAIFYIEKNFGFIKDSQSQQKIFFHKSDANYEVREGDIVSFELANSLKGFCAKNVIKQA